MKAEELMKFAKEIGEIAHSNGLNIAMYLEDATGEHGTAHVCSGTSMNACVNLGHLLVERMDAIEAAVKNNLKHTINETKQETAFNKH